MWADDCVLWDGPTDRHGYGQVWEGRTVRPAHRVVYEDLVGPVPPGLDLGHACHDADPGCPGGPCAHRRCVNPAHLEPQDRQTNLRAGLRARVPVCRHGHARTPENVYVSPSTGRRSCRPCRAATMRAWRAST